MDAFQDRKSRPAEEVGSVSPEQAIDCISEGFLFKKQSAGNALGSDCF